MRSIRVIFEDPSYNYITSINGTIESIKEYFMGKYLQFGDYDFGIGDDLQQVIDIEFLEE